MIYKCKNCDGNMIYHVEERKMYCPYCSSMDSERLVLGRDMYVCECCGGEIPVGQYDSAGKCPSCSQYIIHDERVLGEYKPGKILPFKVGKEQAKTLIRLEYEKKMYSPDSFLAEANLEKMEGTYVPFWLYNFNANFDFHGTGTRVRTWTTGNTEFTETSYYDVYRNFDAAFRKMPVDASVAMPDEVMDMMEPYEYGAMENFDPKYMSGFLGEIYSADAKTFEPRAGEKVRRDAEALLDKALRGFNRITPIEKKLTATNVGSEYVLLPVWKYIYSYRGKKYEYYINGQTGKVVGDAPLSIAKMIAYPSTIFFMIVFGISMLYSMFLGV